MVEPHPAHAARSVEQQGGPPPGSGVRRLAFNTFVPMVAGLVGKGLDFAFALVYLRVLREEGTAVFTFLIVFTTYLDTLINFGFNTLLARDVGRAPGAAPAAFRTVAVTRLGLWLAGLPLVATVLGPARELAGLPPEAAPAGWLFYLALLPSLVASTASGLLWAAERLEIPALVSVLTTVLKISFGLVVLLAGYGLIGLAATSVVVNVMTAAVLSALLLRVWGVALSQMPGALPRSAVKSAAAVQRSAEQVQPVAPDARPPATNPRAARGGQTSWTTSPEATDRRPLPVLHPHTLVRESWPLFLNQLLAGLFFKIDSLLLPALAGLHAAGVYGAAYKVIDGAGVISSSFTLALFPRLARRAESAGGGLASAYRLALRFLLQVAVPLAAGTALLAEPIIALVGGAAFLPEGAVALALLIWFLPFSFANGLTQYVLIALGQQRFLTGVFVVAVLFNLSANFMLIPRWGFVGAALVTIASELVLLVPFFWAAGRNVHPRVSFLRELRAPVLATLLMAPVVWWLRDAIHPLAAVLAGVLVYPAALWSVGGIDAEQWAILRGLVASSPRRRSAPAE